MEKKSRGKLISIIIFTIIFIVLSTGLFGCQVLSRFTGNNNSTAGADTGAKTYTVDKGTIIQSISAAGTVDS